MPSKLYVKLNRTFGFGQQTLWGTWADTPNYAFVFTPTNEAPNETYLLRVLGNFLSAEYVEPLVPGIYPVENPLANIDVSNLTFSWGNIIE